MIEFFQTCKNKLLKIEPVLVIIAVVLVVLGGFFFGFVFAPPLTLPAIPSLLSQAQLEKEKYTLAETITQSMRHLPPSPLSEVIYSRDGSLVAVSYKEGWIAVYQVATGKLIFQLAKVAVPAGWEFYASSFVYPTRVKLSPDNKYLARYGGGIGNMYTNKIEIYEIATLNLVNSIQPQIVSTEVEFNMHAPLIAVRTNKQELTVVKIGQPQPIAFIRNVPQPVIDLPGQAIRSDYTRPDLSNNLFYNFKFIGENRLAVLASVCTVSPVTSCPYRYRWGVIKIDTAGYELFQDLDRSRFSEHIWYLSENGRDIFLTKPQEIVLLNGQEGTITNKISLSFEATISEKAFSSDGKLVVLVRQASSQSDRSIWVFTTEGGRLLADISLPENVTHLQFVPNKLQLAAVTIPLTFQQWNLVQTGISAV